MTTEIKVLRENVINTLSSIKDDNVSIANITISRARLLEALKLQTQHGADILTITYGNVSWEYTYQLHNDGSWEYDPHKTPEMPCVQISCDHTIMRFLNSPKLKNGYESKTIPLNFIEQKDTTELTGIPLDTQDLIRALTFVLPCVAGDLTRPVLHCILFECGKNAINLIAADGFRLAIDKINAQGIKKSQILIDLVDILKLLTFLKAVKTTGTGKNKIYADVYFSFSDKTAKFSTENGFIEFEQPKGKFPNYAQLIPKDGTTTEFISNDMLQAVKGLSHIANNGSSIVRLQFSKGINEVSPGKITFTAKSEELGESSVECDALVESDGKIGVNNRYIIDLMRLCKDIKIAMKTTVPSSPMLFEIGDNQKCIIMPMFVQW